MSTNFLLYNCYDKFQIKSASRTRTQTKQKTRDNGKNRKKNSNDKKDFKIESENKKEIPPPFTGSAHVL